MKRIIFGAGFLVAAVASLPASAANQSICTAVTTAGNGAAVAVGSFVKVTFTPKCSANVFLTGNDQNANLYTVGAASIKGKSYFDGSSAGGAVRRVGDCGGTNGVCRQDDANTGATSAPSS